MIIEMTMEMYENKPSDKRASLWTSTTVVESSETEWVSISVPGWQSSSISGISSPTEVSFEA